MNQLSCTDLAQKIPHRPPMHWINAASIASHGVTVARRKISEDHPFLQNSRLMRSALIELMSQTAACGSAHAAGVGRKIAQGALVGIRNLRFVGNVQCGDEVVLESRVLRTTGSLSLCEIVARVGDSAIASGKFTFHVQYAEDLPNPR